MIVELHLAIIKPACLVIVVLSFCCVGDLSSPNVFKNYWLPPFLLDSKVDLSSRHNFRPFGQDVLVFFL
jgi:hypothetical protein